MIVLNEVTKAFGKRTVLDHVSLRIAPKEFVCIVGPSGAGKSTLIRLLIGADQATSGKIEVDGVDLQDIPPSVLQLYRRRVGVVFQDYKLIAHRTVAENIAFPLELTGVSDKEMGRKVGELLVRMDLTSVASSRPDELSGGEQARTAIARAIVHNPMVVLLDEPTGNLDPKQSLQILKLFQEIQNDGVTILLATHDAGLVERLQTRVVLLEDGKVASDKKGGYPGQDKQPGSHEILKTTEIAESSSSGESVKKKVKVTMIHS